MYDHMTLLEDLSTEMIREIGTSSDERHRGTHTLWCALSIWPMVHGVSSMWRRTEKSLTILLHIIFWMLSKISTADFCRSSLNILFVYQRAARWAVKPMNITWQIFFPNMVHNSRHSTSQKLMLSAPLLHFCARKITISFLFLRHRCV